MSRFLPSLRSFVRRLAVGTGLTLASLGVSLLVLEVSLRLLDGVPVFSTENFVGAALDQVHGKGMLYDPRIGWLPASNLQTGQFTTGQYGVRMSSSKIVPLQQGAILMVGDSFGAGAGVPDADAWPAMVEHSIGSQVIDAAVGGYGFDQIVMRAEMLLPLLKPRMLLVQARLEYGNSVNRMSVAGGPPKPYYTVENDQLILHNVPVPKVASSSHDLGWERAIFGHSYIVQYVMTRLNLLQWWVTSMRIKWELSESEGVDVSCLLMRRLADVRDREGIRVALVIQYSALEAIEDPLHWESDRARTLGCAKHQGLQIVDTLEALRSVYKNAGEAAYQRLWQMTDNNRVYGHMSAEGDRLIADIVLKELFADEVTGAK